ncbi:hypothetical protein [Pelagicoccus albus]|uniref:Uncharacterized protein n=1 Tax=Pelagicoccus albus TaxID=415222 RepID=A0A7X1B9A7_9BACT|nr:hypothetical protein [Pelagicoccus albus]MBC2608051.1 hypothetical protein [Pelagicoccus albus]
MKLIELQKTRVHHAYPPTRYQLWAKIKMSDTPIFEGRKTNGIIPANNGILGNFDITLLFE